MSTELLIPQSRGIDEALWNALTTSIFPGAEDQSVALAYDYCKARGLDVLKKPCHIVPMNVKDSKTGKYSWRDVIMPGIAEQRITACRTGEYAGQDPPSFGEMVEQQFGKKKHTVPDSCTVTVYRLINGDRVGFSHTEYFEEACATTKEGDLNSMWTRRKRGQLAKCAEAGALRKAFPEELGGVTTAEETLTEVRDITPPKTKARSKVEALTTFPEPIQEADGEHSSQSRPSSPVSDGGDDGVKAQDASSASGSTRKTIPPQGKQTKERYQDVVTLLGLSDSRTSNGKTWWSIQVETPKGATVDLNTFNSTMIERLEGLIGEKLDVIFTQTPKGGFAIEEFEIAEGGSEEVA